MITRPCPICDIALEPEDYKGFRDRQEFKRRHESLETDPARKAAFDEAVANMPLEKDPFSQGMKESVLDALGHILFRTPLRWPFR